MAAAPLSARAAALRAAAGPLLLAGAALAVYLVPGWSDALVYDRAAIAAGQWWRLATGNLVHFGRAHLAADLTALLVLGTVAQLRWHAARRAGRQAPHLGRLCFATALAVGAVLFIAEPGLDRYGGLSGIVTAVLLALLLEGFFCGDGRRRVWAIGLALAGIKLAAECRFNGSWLAAVSAAPFEAVPLSHATGAAVALLLQLRTRQAPRPAPTARAPSHACAA